MIQNIETETSRNRNLLLTNKKEPRNLGLVDSKQVTSPRTIVYRKREKYELSSEQDLASRLMKDSNRGNKDKKVGSHSYGPNTRPLVISKIKDNLLEHLNLDIETYTLIAFVAEKQHLKQNCKGKRPYD
ncbi:hypothetical protein BOTNAR_0678g00020 [Botryotinia narcissicola]|uniref:Uncharacterized protein n=1 Tax=Botryotinia narcissicola TaxID=278944 RepID=A0A4Z1H973_9HELO|nr:hypothetical protein BOTNAR_0678g00020 [Botryotinia narcissicola]